MLYRHDTWRTDCFEACFTSIDFFDDLPESIPESVKGDGFVISYGYTTDRHCGAYRYVARISADDAAGMTRGFEVFLKDNKVLDLSYLRRAIDEKKHTIALFEALLEAVKC